MNQGSDYQMDQGILNPDFTEKEHSYLTSEVLNGLRQAGSLFSLTKTEDIAGFNLSDASIQESIIQTINTTRVSFTFKTNSGSLAYAIVNGEHIYVWGSADYQLKMDNIEIPPYADTGYMNGESFVNEDKVYPSGDFMDLSGNVLYRFKIRSFEGQLSSSTIDAIG
jgi:hypothetical protein